MRFKVKKNRKKFLDKKICKSQYLTNQIWHKFYTKNFRKNSWQNVAPYDIIKDLGGWGDSEHMFEYPDVNSLLYYIIYFYKIQDLKVFKFAWQEPAFCDIIKGGVFFFFFFFCPPKIAAPAPLHVNLHVKRPLGANICSIYTTWRSVYTIWHSNICSIYSQIKKRLNCLFWTTLSFITSF